MTPMGTETLSTTIPLGLVFEFITIPVGSFSLTMSLTDLIIQKILRIKQIEDNKGKTLVSEGIDANYQDMINYSVFALIHLQKS